MPAPKSPFSQETFRFFRALSRNNHKDWMDVNRERYRECVVQPFRQFLEDLSPAVLKWMASLTLRANRRQFLSHQSRYPLRQGQNALQTANVFEISAPVAGRPRNRPALRRAFQRRRDRRLPHLFGRNKKGIGPGAHRPAARNLQSQMDCPTEKAPSAEL